MTSIIRVRQVIEWEELPIEQIIEGQTTLWDHSDPNLRSEIPLDNLATYPLIDEFGHELGIFTSRGTRIWRRCAYIDPDISPYGILVNLRQVHELFTLENDDVQGTEDAPDDLSPGVPYFVYPQAGLKDYGHFQANGIISKILPFLNGLNDHVRSRHHPSGNHHGNNNDDDNDNDSDTAFHPNNTLNPIVGISMQAYNAVMHFTRGHGVQHHDAQLGMVTAAVAGSYAVDKKQANIAITKIDQCKYQLPHKRFESKIEDPDVPRDLRLENVYSINVQAIRPEFRDGRYVYH